MNIFKRMLSLCLTLIMLTSVLTLAPLTSSAAIGGVCGDNLTWRFSLVNGTLTILGEGEMYNLRNSAPWEDHRSEIRTVIIGTGVTSIGGFAFACCSELENISIPLTVTRIEMCAFGECTSLKSITIPDNVTYLGSEAFIYCTSLERVILGNGIAEIKYGTFYECTSLIDVTFGKNLALIDSEAFYGCSSYENIALPDHYVALSYDSFAGTAFFNDEKNRYKGGIYLDDYLLDTYNYNNSSVFVIRLGTKYVAQYAFGEYCGYGTVYYPRTIERLNNPVCVLEKSLGHVEYYYPVARGYTDTPTYGGRYELCPPEGSCGDNVYYKVNDIGTVLTVYGKGAMRDYTDYYNDIYTSDEISTPWYDVERYIDEVIVEEGVTTVGKFAFPSVSKLTLADSITHINAYSIPGTYKVLNLPKSLEFIATDNVNFSTELKEINISEENISYATQDGVLYTKDMSTLIRYPACKEGEHYNVPDTVQSIGEYSFVYTSNLKTIYIPETVTSIDKYAIPSYITILCKLNSVAHTFAKNKKMNYEIVCDHIFTSYTHTPATCTEEGYKTATCDLGCGAVDKVITSPALGHTLTEYKYNNDATCTENGTMSAVCSTCGTKDTKEAENTVLGHSFTEYETIIQADCTHNEIREAFCDRGCGAKDTVTVENSAWGHSFTEYVNDNNATCINDGTESAVCDNGCGTSDTRVIEDSAYGHLFTNYEVISEPSCTEEGIKEALCDNGCGEKDVITEEATGHTIGEWIVIEEPDYSLEGYKIQNCTLCAEVINTETIPALVYEGFPDVPDSAWYYSGVEYCFKQGYIMGNDKGNFDPDGKLTREQFVVILARISGAKLSEYTESNFIDVKADSWYGPSVIWANSEGYINGVGNGRFGVGEVMTRETVAVMLYRYSKDETLYPDLIKGYSDWQSVSSWARDAVNWAVNNEILGSTSTSNAIFSPKMTLTRAQAAKIFMSYDACMNKE